jgi:hypothetical protein
MEGQIMPTPDQIAASRANGAKSRGPVTAEGKRRSAQNSLKHGLTARRLMIPGEDAAEFDELLEGYYDLFQPIGAVEAELVETITIYTWRLRRGASAEASALRRAIAVRSRVDVEFPTRLADPDAGDNLGAAFIDLDTQGFVTRSLTGYEARLVRVRKQTVQLLQQAQVTRRARDEQAGRHEGEHRADDVGLGHDGAVAEPLENVAAAAADDSEAPPLPRA